MIDEHPAGIDRGKAIPRCQLNDEIAMAVHRRAGCGDKASIRKARKFRDPALDLAGIARVDRNNVDADRSCYRLNDGELPDAGGYGRVPDNPDADGRWHRLLEQLQPFRAQAVIELHEAGHIAAGLREALDKTAADGIDGGGKHNGYLVGSLQHGRGCRASAGDDDLRILSEQFGDALADIGITRLGAVDEHLQVLPVDPAEVAQ